MTGNHEVVVDELSGDVPGRAAGDVDPDTREEGAAAHDEDDIDQSVNGVLRNFGKSPGRADVVCEAANRLLMTGHVVVLPLAEQADQEVAAEALGKDLGEEINIGDEGGLQDDRNVRGVEELDRERLLDTALLLRRQVENDLEVLDVDDNKHDENRRDQVVQIRRTLSHEGLVDGHRRVRLGDEEVEQGNDGALKLGSLVRADRDRGEALPDDVLADVGGNKQADARTETVALVQELIEHEDHEASNEQLSDNERSAEKAKLTRGTVHA